MINFKNNLEKIIQKYYFKDILFSIFIYIKLFFIF